MKTKQLVIALACWAMANVVQAQIRGAVWVHGLGSTQDEWGQWDALFTAERQLNTLSRLPFNTDLGVAQMASDVRDSYASAASPQNIYFGHSMGGVTGRHIDTDPGSPNTFGAIITAGSPHDGARIANAVRNGELVNAVADGVTTMAAGPANDLVLNVLTFNSFSIAGLYVGLTVDQLKASAQAYINNGFSNQGVTDLMEGSGYMNSNPRYTQTGTAKLLIYGNEESPVHWRMASEAVYHDERLVGWAQTVGDVYEGFMWANYGFAAIAGVFTFGLGAIPFVYSAIQWSRGMNWVRYDSERVWSALIGANSIASHTVCYQQIDYYGFNQCLNDIGNTTTYEEYLMCQQRNTSDACYTYYASTNNQSDGFIKASSQTGYYSGWANNATRVEALAVNHLEMSKHPRMRTIYNEAFDNVYGQAFAVPTR